MIPLGLALRSQPDVAMVKRYEEVGVDRLAIATKYQNVDDLKRQDTALVEQI